MDPDVGPVRLDRLAVPLRQPQAGRAVTALRGTITAEPHITLYALLAVAVTAGTHLAFGRRSILSVGIGTAVYVILVNAF